MDHVERRRVERRWYARLSFASLVSIAVLPFLIAWDSPESADALGEVSGILNVVVPTLGLIVCVYLGIGHKENLNQEDKG